MRLSPFVASFAIALPVAFSAASEVRADAPMASNDSFVPVVTFNSAPAASSVLLLPFAPVSPDSQTDWLAKAIDESLRADLSQNSAVQLVQLKADSADPKESARRSGASIVISGNYQLVDSQLRVTAQALDVESGRVLATSKVTGTVKGLFSLEDALSAELRKGLPGSEGTELNMLTAANPQSTPAAPAPNLYDYNRVVDGGGTNAYAALTQPTAGAEGYPEYYTPSYSNYAPPQEVVYNNYIYAQDPYAYDGLAYDSWIPFDYGLGFGVGFYGGYGYGGFGYGGRGFHHHGVATNGFNNGRFGGYYGGGSLGGFSGGRGFTGGEFGVGLSVPLGARAFPNSTPTFSTGNRGVGIIRPSGSGFGSGRAFGGSGFGSPRAFGGNAFGGDGFNQGGFGGNNSGGFNGGGPAGHGGAHR